MRVRHHAKSPNLDIYRKKKKGFGVKKKNRVKHSKINKELQVELTGKDDTPGSSFLVKKSGVPIKRRKRHGSRGGHIQFQVNLLETYWGSRGGDRGKIHSKKKRKGPIAWTGRLQGAVAKNCRVGRPNYTKKTGRAEKKAPEAHLAQALGDRKKAGGGGGGGGGGGFVFLFGGGVAPGGVPRSGQYSEFCRTSSLKNTAKREGKEVRVDAE